MMLKLADAASEAAALLPAWIAAIGTAGGVIVAALAIILAYQQLRLTATQIRDAAMREAQDSEERTRPYIGIDVVPSLAGSPAFDVVIKNHGLTVAREIRVSLQGDTDFAAQSENDQIGPALGRLFANGFDLAPGASRRVFWRFPDQVDASPCGAFGAPIAADMLVTYSWQPAGDRKTRNYEDEYSYDLTEYPKLTPSPNTGSQWSGSSSDAAGQTRNVVHALRAIAANVGEWRR